MVKSKSKNQQLETYSVIVDGRPVPVEATSLAEAVKKATAEVKEVGDVN